MNTDLRLLPLGTHVVTRVPVHTPSGEVTRPAGAVAVVVRAPADPQHAYRVRFPDGGEHSFLRRELDVRKHHKDLSVPPQPDWMAFVQYRCVVGSRAFGLETDASDTDRRGFYLPPADAHWSLWGVPEQLEDHDTQETYWELQKFLTLALKANPNVLECLYTPLVETASPLALDLLDMRDAFLSTLVYQTYNGYVLSQFGKLEADLRNHGEIRWKHAMHLLRLLMSGIAVLESGEVLVHVGERREDLLAVKRGDVPWADLDRWRLDLHARFDAALPKSRLPERPDYERVNAFLLRARRGMLEVRA
ncbi:nucleotidyltransferase domain-containing protein [Deinococcus pimensis]|uniref:nucleotidyltransferase domain-containing protein n=1 Tax=Deinococcus pimensis TaxID=309888 RepID=UPI00048880FF|nr:nucleotidyltransferase domain-containing protein [Deinococcus pimensis]